MRSGGLVAAVALGVGLAGCAVSSGATRSARPTVTDRHRPRVVGAAGGARAGVRRAPVRRAGPPYAVGERVITFVDHSRTVRLPGRPPEARRLVTVVRYPIAGGPSRVDVRNAVPDRAAGPFPLIVFGHGFAVTPATYYRLLTAWAAAGYVVAAPVFPRENAHAPGGPNESDLVNQPRDMSFVISGLLAASAHPHTRLAGVISPRQIAVSGQSDGGETALAVAYDRRYRDRRVRAAVILSGAQIPGVGTLSFPRGAPALLATQGTGDTVNLPRYTYAFFALAHDPKFLLTLLGAPHLAPYTDEEPQLGIVERVSIDFLDRYLKGDRAAVAAARSAGDRPGVSALTACP